MKKYFDRFKDLKENKEKQIEANTPLIDRISIGEMKVISSYRYKPILFDGKDVFRSYNGRPLYANVVGILPDAEDSPSGTIFIGTGECCHGHLYIFGYGGGLFNHENSERPELTNVYPIDFNIYDILPLDQRIVLVTGFGCSGSGVRLVNNIHHGIYDIISSDSGIFEGRHREYESPALRAERDITLRFGGTHNITIESLLEKIPNAKTDTDFMKEINARYKRIKIR